MLGIEHLKVEQETKKKSRKMAKFQRAITGATLEDIMKKRNQKPEVRKAQREQAIRLVDILLISTNHVSV